MLPASVRASLKDKQLLDFGLTVEAGAFSFAEHYCILPTALVAAYALAIAASGKASRVLLAGFDGKGPDAADVAGAQLREQGSRMAAFLGSVDVALCPTIGGERPKLGHLAPHLPYDVVLARMRRLAGFTALHNQAGAPAMTLPLHHDPHGHPVGVQFAASPGQDERLLSLALQVEAACGGWNRGPRGG